MSWLNRSKRAWRVVLLTLLLVAIAGPWWFDRILVPAQYTCSAPNVRLEGDFCGMPVPGSWMPLAVAGGLIPMVVELLTGTAILIDRIRDLFINLLVLLPVLPSISTLFMILGERSRRQQVFHIIVLGLAASFALFMGTAGFSRFWWMLWGLWLYIGLIAIALVLEVLTFNSEKETRLGIKSLARRSP
jgi:hypothetical protein